MERREKFFMAIEIATSKYGLCIVISFREEKKKIYNLTVEKPDKYCQRQLIGVMKSCKSW